MKKVLAGVVMGVALTGAMGAQAESAHGEQLAECKQELAAIYGKDARVRINGVVPGSDTLTLRVYPKGERLQRVECVQSAEGEVRLLGQTGLAKRASEQTTEALTAL
ncbi:hypothetical protein F0M18_17990 [Pseudohalioglobus sediminis]|uniref:Secreted protein n=1 Tax=Pseudohalioglobus sediminis TaxID=2606449 RepID=A0A5B0WMV6_9GAMM|nr:hypothetical protein [Pseudohalioglobus sediminis]KAA1188390.1 hypothetical protein F0M18_17990 [Pseudohalioglobus sediminis]